MPLKTSYHFCPRIVNILVTLPTNFQIPIPRDSRHPTISKTSLSLFSLSLFPSPRSIEQQSNPSDRSRHRTNPPQKRGLSSAREHEIIEIRSRIGPLKRRTGGERKFEEKEKEEEGGGISAQKRRRRVLTGPTAPRIFRASERASVIAGREQRAHGCRSICV